MAARKRITLNLPDSQRDRFNAIHEKDGAKTMADTIRNAMRVYEWYLGEMARNGKIQVERDGKTREVEFMF